jgi:hypothetical protein
MSLGTKLSMPLSLVSVAFQPPETPAVGPTASLAAESQQVRIGTTLAVLVSNGSMKEWSAVSQWRVSALAFALLIPATTPIAAYQPPVQQSDTGRANGLKLNAAEEKDSYEIYSMLLRTELPPQWNITGWAIEQETQTYPNFGGMSSVAECLQPSKNQESIYRPLIDGYVAKNKGKLALERKFDLPQYALIGPTEIKAIQQRSRAADGFPFNAFVIFHVSAVGFNRDGTRALVHVGHNCGSLCGGGGYHFLMKKDGRWQVDREYGGMSCSWAS